MLNRAPLLLADVIRDRNLVLATCLDCWHQRVLDPLPLARCCGAGATLADLARRLRCGCGSARCHVGVRLGEMGYAGARLPERPRL